MRAVDARRTLLTGLIDHAPMFPPASMAAADALAEDRRTRASEHAWLLGRFVVPEGTEVKDRELAGEHRAAAAELARTRAGLLHSIGSCSFFEPVGELREQGIL